MTPTTTWLPAERPPDLAPGEVHVWRVEVDATEAPDLLAPDEEERRGRFVRNRDRHRYAVCRGLLRRLLGDYLGRDPSSFAFVEGPHGKPELPGETIRFNLSHAGRLALLAFTPDRDVGVDVEEIRERDREDDLARRFFRSEEAGEIRARPPGERAAAFFSVWTRKEAVLKATGRGITLGLDRYRVVVDPEAAPFVVAPDDAPPCAVAPLDPGEGYAAAVALVGREPFAVTTLAWT
jgi:4'-phosphopantetheinyl transferase